MDIVDRSSAWQSWSHDLDAMLDQHALEQGVPFACPQLVLVAYDTDKGFLGGLRGFYVQGRFALEELAVMKAARGRGVGKALMREMEVTVVANGAKAVYLGTWEFQAPWLYQGLGYQEFGRLPAIEGHPAKIWYAKSL